MKKSTTKIAACLMTVFCLFAMTKQAVAQDPDWTFTSYYDDDDFLPGELIDAVTPAIVAAPNPTSDAYLKVWYKQLEQNSQLTLNDISGKRVHFTELGGDNKKSEGMYLIPVKHLPKGVYVVNLTSGIYKMSRKVIIR